MKYIAFGLSGAKSSPPIVSPGLYLVKCLLKVSLELLFVPVGVVEGGIVGKLHNFLVSLVVVSRSQVAILNRIGLRALPWGVPWVVWRGSAKCCLFVFGSSFREEFFNYV